MSELDDRISGVMRAAAAPMSPEGLASAPHFPSLAVLRTTQAELRDRRRQQGDSPEVLDAIAVFVARGVRTGVLLDDEADRWSAQGVLDYWAAALERAGRPRPDSTLADFDELQAPELPDDACPYIGLNAFDERDRRWFFGRDTLVAELQARLAKERLLAVVGPSGSGKSSLVRAGLVPALERGALPGSESWRVLGATIPGSHPGAALERTVGALVMGGVPALLADAAAAPVVVIIDQFEEAFTLCTSEAERAGFIDDLLALAGSPAGHRVILTVRSDFESFVARAPALYALFTSGRVPVTPPSAAELREAIERPAALVGLRFEAGVIETLLQELLGEPAGLPLLQFTLARLWEERTRNRVTLEAYKRVGGGRKALANTADALYESLIPEDQRTARRILLRLALAADDRQEITRARVARSQLVGREDPGRVDRVLERLVKARLLRVSSGGEAAQLLSAPAGGETAVEVAHEALVRNWPRLAEWLQQGRAALAERRRLEAKAIEWVRLGRGASGLLDDVALAEVERWLSSPEVSEMGASEELMALVAESRGRIEEAERQREAVRAFELETARELAAVERRAAQRLRWLVAALGVGMALVVGLTLYATRQARRANHHSLEAARQTDLARSRLRTQLEEQGRRAYLRSASQEALTFFEEVEKSGGASPVARFVMARAAEDTFEAQLARIEGHGGAIHSAAWSPDGARLLTASSDGTARMWDSAQPERGVPSVRVLAGHQGSVIGAEWLGRAGDVVTAGSDGTVRVWDAESSAQKFSASLGEPVVCLVATRGDAPRFFAVSRGGRIGLWEASGRRILDEQSGGAELFACALSADGKRAAAGGSGFARLWDVDRRKAVTLPSIDKLRVLAFSPSARLLVSAGEGRDRDLHLWDAASGAPLAKLSGHFREVLAVAFSPDEKLLASGGADRNARLWSIPDGALAAVLGPHTGVVTAIAFTPDGERLVTAGYDRAAHLWSARGGLPIASLQGHASGITAASFSPDGRYLLTASEGKTARVWRGDRKLPALLPLDATSTEARRIACRTARTSDARHTATIDESGAVLLTEAGNPTPRRLTGHAAEVTCVAFSPDGSRLVTASRDRTARLWEATTGELIAILEGHNAPLRSASFRDDGELIVTAGEDHAALLWGARDGELVARLDAHERPLSFAAFDPGGESLITEEDAGGARHWPLPSLRLDAAHLAQRTHCTILYRMREGRVLPIPLPPDCT